MAHVVSQDSHFNGFVICKHEIIQLGFKRTLYHFLSAREILDVHYQIPMTRPIAMTPPIAEITFAIVRTTSRLLRLHSLEVQYLRVVFTSTTEAPTSGSPFLEVGVEKSVVPDFCLDRLKVIILLLQLS